MLTKKELEETKFHLFAEIGEQVHYLFRTNGQADILDDEKIKAAVQEVTRIDKEIYKTKPLMYPKIEDNKCPACKADIAPRAVYCYSCGQHVLEFYTNNIKLCDGCDNLVDIGSAFCPVCGARFGGE